MRRWVMGLSVALALACGGDEQAGGGAASSDMPAAAGGSLQIEHLVEGTGPSPTPEDTVQVHYHGTFPDGTVFDSSVDRGQPAEFPLNRVIKCWTEGVAKMKEGGKATLICPPDIAYGSRATGAIPANATLAFDVELIEIVQ